MCEPLRAVVVVGAVEADGDTRELLDEVEARHPEDAVIAFDHVEFTLELGSPLIAVIRPISSPLLVGPWLWRYNFQFNAIRCGVE